MSSHLTAEGLGGLRDELAEVTKQRDAARESAGKALAIARENVAITADARLGANPAKAGGENGTIRAYHFVADKLRDGRPIPADGETLTHDDELELCRSGLHASVDPFDALVYAPGNTLCLVDCGGEIVHDSDKLVCSERTIVARIDAEDLLRSFARWCALQVIDLWDAPDVVRQYLETGDESLRLAAWAAAWDARDAQDVAGAAAQDAAWAAAGAAGAAAAAAWAAARDAQDAARDAARDAAGAAAGAAQRAEFRRLVDEAFAEAARED